MEVWKWSGETEVGKRRAGSNGKGQGMAMGAEGYEVVEGMVTGEEEARELRRQSLTSSFL